MRRAIDDAIVVATGISFKHFTQQFVGFLASPESGLERRKIVPRGCEIEMRRNLPSDPGKLQRFGVVGREQTIQNGKVNLLLGNRHA